MNTKNIKIQLELTADETFMLQALINCTKEQLGSRKADLEIISKKIEKAHLKFALINANKQQTLSNLYNALLK